LILILSKDHRKNCNFSPLQPRRRRTDGNKTKARVYNIAVAALKNNVDGGGRPGPDMTRQGDIHVPIGGLTPDSPPRPRQHSLTDTTTWISCSPEVDASSLLQIDSPPVWPATTAPSVSPTGSIRDAPSVAHSLPTPESLSSVVDREEVVIAPENVTRPSSPSSSQLSN
jgi:hypothetical protein